VSTLTLVRHGQAHPFQGREAPLTPLGEQQAARLAAYWLRYGVSFDEVYSGTLPRQVRTEEVIGECFREAGQPWPAATRDASWNEYDAPGILRGLTFPGDMREFQRMFEAAMVRWLEASSETAGVESWPVFRTRVSGVLQRLMAGPTGRRVAVFTSGGPIGFTVHTAVQAPSRTFLDLNWRIRNTAVSHFLYDRTRLTLDAFNTIPHLEDESLWTYR
jgi:broad specificity phosphatase PhoE